jgi:hypothetical protein
MIDENAFGLLVSYHDIEEDDYALGAGAFVERFHEFTAAWRECLRIFRLGDPVRAIDFGHAVYVEVADGDQEEEPIVWLKQVRGRIAERAFSTVGVVSYGSRWVDPAIASMPIEELGNVSLVNASLPSEALRRALWAEAAARHEADDAPEGWGPGLYVQSDAIEALGRSFKNAPTPLSASGTTFYRVGK